MTQLDFVVDGTSVLQRVLSIDLPSPYGFTRSEFVSVVDLAWPEHSALRLRQLAGQAERDLDWDVLEPGRLPLYGCPECNDVYCGALTVAVHREVDPVYGREVVSWTQLRCEDARTPAEEMPDLSPVGSFTFNAAQYDATLTAALARMEELARVEREADTAWQAQRTLGARLRRLLRSTARQRFRERPASAASHTPGGRRLGRQLDVPDPHAEPPGEVEQPSPLVRRQRLCAQCDQPGRRAQGLDEQQHCQERDDRRHGVAGAAARHEVRHGDERAAEQAADPSEDEPGAQTPRLPLLEPAQPDERRADRPAETGDQHDEADDGGGHHPQRHVPVGIGQGDDEPDRQEDDDREPAAQDPGQAALEPVHPVRDVPGTVLHP